MFLRGKGADPRHQSVRHRGVRRTAAVTSVAAVGGQARLVLVTGGARAGKSRFAQSLAEENGFAQRLFVATAIACDKEMATRIRNHQKSRDGRWSLLEEPTQLPEKLQASRLKPNSVVLLDCLPTFTSNLLLKKRSPSQIQKRIVGILTRLRKPGVTSILVSNEVGLGVVPDHPLGRTFRDLLGQVNQQVAQAADEVYWLVAGIPVRIK